MGFSGQKKQTYALLNKHSVTTLNGKDYPTKFWLGTGSQVTQTQSNAWPPQGDAKRGNVGGIFVSIKDSSTMTGDQTSYLRYQNSNWYYRGPIAARITAYNTLTTNLWPSVVPSTALQMMGYGTTAIARCIPTNPVAGLSNFLGEIKRDGLPALVGSAFAKPIRSRSGKKTKYNLSSLGDEYLNLQFAWAPYVSDLQKFGRVVKDSEKILTQYRKNSGKDIHRRYSFPTESTTTVEKSSCTNLYPVIQGETSFAFYANTTGSVLTKTTTTKVDRWFSGCFTYHLDYGTDAISKLNRSVQEANKLLGIRINPELVWNLTPWSWAADWLGNIGDIAHNVSAFAADGLVMRYGYIMEHKISTIEYSVSGYTWNSSSSNGPLTVKQSFTRESKVRYPATPFGFGLNTSTFSGRQWAIIAALGISKKPRAL